MQELLDGIETNAYGLERLDISCRPRLNKPTSDTPDAESPIQRELDTYIYIPPIAPTLTALSSTLRILSIPASSMSIDTLIALSRLPYLESLAFTGSWCSDAHGDEWPELDPALFASLERLSLPCSVEPATRLLSILPEATPLRTVKISSPDMPTDQSISELCISLSRFQISLRNLSMSSPTPILAPIDQTQTNWSAFSLLLSCIRLESLTLGLPIELSEADCAMIVRAFPRLRVLSLLAKVSHAGRAQLAKLQHLTEFRAGTDVFASDSLLVGVHSPPAMLHQGAPQLMADMYN
ncbi:hypothetical protein BDV93DRAFT_554475 [Ceratobasidium sp. AG-I]|nr:hypothetical protein BDV93DRAFT_554475 [Ceratobasidium sp. AG-I]